MTLVLLAVVILLAAGVGLLSLGLNSRIFAIRTASGITARCAADAGLTKAVFELNEKLKVNPAEIREGLKVSDPLGSPAFQGTTSEALPNCDATFSYKITAASIYSTYGLKDLTVESIGRCGQAEKTVYATVGLEGLFTFPYGILVQSSLILMKDTSVDGYNSMDPGATDVPVTIATTSTIPWHMITYGADVDGEILLGVNADFPEVTPPVLADMGTDIKVQGTTLKIGPANSGKYTGLTLKTKAVLEIGGGDVVLHMAGNMLLGQGCEILIKSGSSLTLYLDGNLIAGNSNGINNETMIPGNFKLYGTGDAVQKFELKAKSGFYGAIYAPNADTTIKAGGDIYGACISSNFQMMSKSNFHYDEALSDASVDDEGVRFVVKHWRE